MVLKSYAPSCWVFFALAGASLAQTIYEPYAFATLAGNSWAGSADGDRTQATFHNPTAIAADGYGNLYIADTENHVIRRISPDGEVSNFAGLVRDPGLADGTGNQARFNSPWGIATDSKGNVFVADTGSHTVRKITPAAQVTTLAGMPGHSGSADGPGPAARFFFPKAVVVDSSGNAFISDSSNQTIRKIAPDGHVTTFAGSAGQVGSIDGLGGAARFFTPEGIAADAAGNLYVCDASNSTLRKITAAGLVSTFVGSPGNGGSADGTGSMARFNNPRGVAVDSAGYVYVGDTQNFRLRKVTPAGVVSTIAGSYEAGYADGLGADARFREPYGLSLDAGGNLYIADKANHLIRKSTPSGSISTYSGVGGNVGGTNGSGRAARFYYPHGVALDSTRNLFVADRGGRTVRKITSSGLVSTVAGAFLQQGSVDASGADARFGGPADVAVDKNGYAYVADSFNRTIRKIAPNGAVSTFAGLANFSGSADGTGSTARFSSPEGVAVDLMGNVFVADTYNHTIRKITPAAEVTTLAGKPGTSDFADGTGSAARFSNPTSLVVDATGDIFVADRDNSRIRKVTPQGVVTTIAGTGVVGSRDGLAATAEFAHPEGITIDEFGNLYVADTQNNLIRKISVEGGVTTLAGALGFADPADGTGASAHFSGPTGIAVDASGTIYVGDNQNAIVRIGRVPPPAPFISKDGNGDIVLAGSARPNSEIEVKATGHPSTAFLKIGSVTTGADGTFRFEDLGSSSTNRRLYRASVPIP